MAKEFKVRISTPTKLWLDKEVAEITMPTANGYVGILPEHARICGAVMPGYMYITFPNGEKQTALINYGTYYFKDNKLIILSDFFEYDKGINESALDSIRQRIEDECKKVQLSDRAIHALNSYMKLVSAKAKQKK